MTTPKSRFVLSLVATFVLGAVLATSYMYVALSSERDYSAKMRDRVVELEMKLDK